MQGEWQLEFIEGGPVLPGRRAHARARELDHHSMTRRQNASRAPRVIAWSSTRREARRDEWLLDLGDVRETARVTLNGKRLGDGVEPAIQVAARTALKPRGNVLEIEVTNLPANRIRDLDVRKVPWKIMRDINLVTREVPAVRCLAPGKSSRRDCSGRCAWCRSP